MKIRNATTDDAPAICALLRRSISELCVADHRNDPAILQRWLYNKTPDNVVAWISRQDSSLLVVVDDETILAAGTVTYAGEIILNYVLPDVRFRGASRALLKALEDRALVHGNVRSTLTSTATAHHFYETAGYADDAPPVHKSGMSGYPMSKQLVSDAVYLASSNDIDETQP